MTTTPPAPLPTRLLALAAGSTLALTLLGAGVSGPARAATPASAASAAVAPAPAAPAAAARLTVKPRVYVGGQRLTWTGNIGVRGRRTVRLQRNLGRPGDQWKPVEGTASKTNRDGGFRFGFKAPTMVGIKFRVAAGRRTTPAKTFSARSQDVTLRPTSTPVAGRSFTIVADTAPDDLKRRPDTPSPVFAGRELTLQRRDVTGAVSRGYASPWRTVGSTRSNEDGLGWFRQTVESSGTVVYRVRMENWNEDGDRIGWFPSFPTPVGIRSSARAATVSRGADSPRDAATEDTDQSQDTEGTRGVVMPAAKQGAGTNAGQKRGWTPALWDYDWPYGESLSSRPFRGTRSKGRWLDWSTGTGRADLHNGALKLDSQRDNVDGSGDRGSTGVTLRGNAATYGRWEMRLRMKSSETSHREYRTLVELVPEKASDYDCGANTITIANLRAHGKGYRFGARSDGQNRKWTGRRGKVRFNNTTHHFAVEVGKKHLSWFLDGRLVGTVKSRAAVPGVPMTMRFRMVGKGSKEMNRTQAIADWARAFPLSSARSALGGKRLRTGRYAGGC